MGQCTAITEMVKEEGEMAETGIGSGYMTDEIELIDLFRIVWKWRRFIIIGTLLCMLVTAGISLMMPKVYRIDMVIRPGVVGVDDEGQSIHTDTEEDMKAIIEAGTFDQQIKNALAKTYPASDIRNINWHLSSSHGTNTVKVSYNTTSTRLGLFVVSALYKNLVAYYQPEVEKYKKKFQIEVEKANTDILKLKADIASKKIQLANDQQRVAEIDGEIDRISGNQNDLISQRRTLLQKEATGRNTLSAMIYSNMIQQNTDYVNTLKTQKNSLLNAIAETNAAIQRAGHDIEMNQEKIRYDKYNESAVQNIQALQPPLASKQPVKPRVVLNIVLAFVLGLMVMVFAAFLVEYIRQNMGHGAISANRDSAGQ